SFSKNIVTTTTVSRRTFSSRSRHNASRYTVQTLSFPEPSGGLTLTLTPQRRVIGKAEYLEKGANPRFIVHIIIGGAHGRARSIRKLLLRARHGRPLTPVHQTWEYEIDRKSRTGFVCIGKVAREG